MALRMYNTLTRREERFEPLKAGHVGLYVCGPTVYDMSHVGHARAYVAFDTLVRYLRQHVSVTYVRNVTDIDDKIIQRAQACHQSIEAVSAQFMQAFRDDMAALGVLPADVEPQATQHIGEMIALIETLVACGHAYLAGGDVLYAVARFGGYGRLGRRSLEERTAESRIEASGHKQHPMDFVLWKAAKPGEPFWASPWGPGRPGWHVECSAMARRYLGETFDMHGGGSDLIFPHHENEIAQSEAASGKLYAKIWLHNGLVNVAQEKMSKSLGNSLTIRSLLEKFEGQSVRLYLLSTHYRSPIHFNEAHLKEADQRLKYMYETLQRLGRALTPGSHGPPYRQPWVAHIVDRFEEAMQQDLNTPRALGDLSDVFKLINETLAHPEDPPQDARTLRAIDQAIKKISGVLGLFETPADIFLHHMARHRQGSPAISPETVDRLLAERQQARGAQDYRRSDEIRAYLQQVGVAIKDSPQGSTWEFIDQY